jgi:hypothetical protein
MMACGWNELTPVRFLRTVRLQIVLAFLLLLAVAAACNPAPPIAVVTPLAQGTPVGRVVSADLLPTPAASDNVTRLPPTPVPTFYAVRMAEGDIFQSIRATDVAMTVVPENPVDLPPEPVPLHFDEFFSGFNPDTRELFFTDKMMALDGRQVVIEGYMAPPLKLGLDWFQLTHLPSGGCVFCATVEEWVPGILQVYAEDYAVPYTRFPLQIRGELHIGPSIDPETGMVSLVRLYADDVKILTR